MAEQQSESFVWWKHGVIYHIYPQSYKDSTGNGTGDLQGIIQKLGYLKELGVDAVWLSPVYASPLIDGGYDISDYYSINTLYGTIEDFKELLDKAHICHIRIIIDIVLNHTSDRHPWFQQSSSSADNPMRGWYIWHKNNGGKKPNNWKTNFGKYAWTLDEQTNEFYYHSFFHEQPDLNWRNQEVKQEMFEMIRYWFDMGVDGIRLDVINLLFKDKHFRNNPACAFFSNAKVYNRNQPELYLLLKELRLLIDEYKNKVSVGEIYTPPPGNSALVNSFLGDGTDMLHLSFDFSIVFSRFNAKQYHKVITNYYQSIPEKAWPCFFISNHDIGRNLKRYFLSCYKYKKAKVLAALLLTLKGTPFIYYGDEIGMENTSLKRHELKDRYGKMFYPFYKGRDKMRTPMQWDNSPYAGFSKVQSWLPVNPNYNNTNVEVEKENPDSIYNLFKQLIAIRKEQDALSKGDIRFIHNGMNNRLLYERYTDKETILVMLNFSFRKQKTGKLTLDENYEVLFSSTNRQLVRIEGKGISLNPFEIFIVKTKEDRN